MAAHNSFHFKLLANVRNGWQRLREWNAPQMFLINYFIFSFFITVGNKNDCPERKVVLTEDATNFAEQMGIQLFETSAKENINVEEVMYEECFNDIVC